MSRTWILGLCALLMPFTPLLAGDVYVPLATNLTLGASTYRTLLILTNTAGTPREVSVSFLANGTNGAAGNHQPASFFLPAGATLRLYNAVPAGARGMLEVSGDAAIVVSARIEALAAAGNVLASAQVPVLSAVNAIGPGERVQLQSLEHTNGAVTDFGLMNLSRNPAKCQVEAFRANGSRIGSAVSLSLLPLSQNEFSSALASLGQTSIKDVRFSVTCDQVFGTFALVYRSGGPETVILGPAASLEEDLKPEEDGGVTFNLPGQFANSSTFAAYDLPLQPGVQYGHARVELDLYIDKWRPAFPLNPMFHNVASFRRSASSRSERMLYWGLILKGSGDYRTILDMGLPPGAHEGTTIKSGKGPWKERTTYHIVFDYDTDAGVVVFEAYQAGKLVQRLSGPLNSLDISNVPGKNVRVDFSSVGVGDGAYFPPLGWKYSNLTVKLTPRRPGRN